MRVRNAVCVRCRAGERPDAGAGQLSRLRRGWNRSGQRGDSPETRRDRGPDPGAAGCRRPSAGPASCRRPSCRRIRALLSPAPEESGNRNLPCLRQTHLRRVHGTVRLCLFDLLPEACGTDRDGLAGLCKAAGGHRGQSCLGGRVDLAGRRFPGGRSCGRMELVHIFRLASARHLFGETSPRRPGAVLSIPGSKPGAFNQGKPNDLVRFGGTKATMVGRLEFGNPRAGPVECRPGRNRGTRPTLSRAARHRHGERSLDFVSGPPRAVRPAQRHQQTGNTVEPAVLRHGAKRQWHDGDFLR